MGLLCLLFAYRLIPRWYYRFVLFSQGARWEVPSLDFLFFRSHCRVLDRMGEYTIHNLLFLSFWCLSPFGLVHRRSNLSGILAYVRIGEGTVAGL